MDPCLDGNVSWILGSEAALGKMEFAFAAAELVGAEMIVL